MSGDAPDAAPIAVRLEPAADSWLPRLRTLLGDAGIAAVVLDLEGVSRLDPALLCRLEAAVEEAERTGKALTVARARPEIYKALHLAGLGALCGIR